MSRINLEIDDKIHRRLSIMFKGDDKAIHDFIVKSITDQIEEISSDGPEANVDTKSDLEDYLKSGKQGSRSYGIKGQGW